MPNDEAVAVSRSRRGMIRSSSNDDQGRLSHTCISRMAPDSFETKSPTTGMTLDSRLEPFVYSPIIACPIGDCCGANRKTPVRSCRTTNLTRSLHSLQTPSNGTTGSGSAGTVGRPPNGTISNRLFPRNGTAVMLQEKILGCRRKARVGRLKFQQGSAHEASRPGWRTSTTL